MSNDVAKVSVTLLLQELAQAKVTVLLQDVRNVASLVFPVLVVRLGSRFLDAPLIHYFRLALDYQVRTIAVWGQFRLVFLVVLKPGDRI